MEARVARLRATIPVHEKRGLEAEAKAAKAKALMDNPRTPILEQCESEVVYAAELRRAKAEARLCEWYEYCIKQWTTA